MSNDNKYSRKCMFLLAIFPILYYYVSPLVFSYGQVFFLIFILYLLLKEKTIRIIEYPRGFKWFWMYAALSLILLSGTFKITYLIPGGINFCLWAINLGICIRYFNIEYLRKYMRTVFLISSFIFILQEILFFGTGYRFVALLPISENFLYGDLSYSDLYNVHLMAQRSSSLFLEPAYFAQYSLCLLLIELFGRKGIDVFLNLFSILIIVIIIFVRSGTGVIGVGLLLFLKVLIYIRNASGIYKLLFYIITLPIISIILYHYIQSEIGTDMIERFSEFEQENTSAYLRVIRGFIVFDYLPTVNKLLGISINELKDLNLPFIIESNDGSIYLNGFQTVLISLGYIGLFMMLSLYIRCLKNTTILVKNSLWLLLMFALVEQIYLMPYMLLLSTIVFSITNKLRSLNEDSIHISHVTF